MKKIILISAAVFLVFNIGACAEKEAADEKVLSIRNEAEKSLQLLKNTKQESSSLTVEQKPWFGNTAVRFMNGEPLPASLTADDALVITFDKPLSLTEIASRIQGASGLRVTVDHAQPASGGGGSAAAGAQGENTSDYFLPADGNEVAGGRVVWQGNLKNLLDQIADRYDAEWSYDGRGIKISRSIVRTFLLHALAGDLKLSGKVSAGSEGLPTQSIDSQVDISVWEEIKEAVDNVIEGRGKATFSPATGTITVAGSPSALKEVENYLRLQNDLRLRRVSVDVRVLSVLFEKSNTFNFDVTAVIKDALGGHPFTYSSASAGDTSRTMSAGIVRSISDDFEPDTGNAVSLVVNALDAVAEDVSVMHSGTIVTMSDQAAPLQVAKKRTYVASVSGSATDGATSTTIEPGTVDIGMTMNILPRVISRDKVMLRLAIGITDLAEMREFTSSGASVQLPEIDTTGFLQNAVLTSGETLVIAGFERDAGNNTEVGQGYSWNFLAGGQKSFGHRRELRVLLLNAKVLPEERFDIMTP